MALNGTPPRIADVRKAHGLTQRELAALAGITQGQLSNLETGVNVPSGLRTAVAIADALRTSIEALWPDLLPQPLTKHRHPRVTSSGVRWRRPTLKNQGFAKR